LAIEADDPGVGPCPLLVQALGYEAASGATGLLLDRFAIGVEKTFAAGTYAPGPHPLGFVGGSVAQHGRLILISDNRTPGPAPGSRLGESGAVARAELADQVGGSGPEGHGAR
jgi:hypothetical protein